MTLYAVFVPTYRLAAHATLSRLAFACFMYYFGAVSCVQRRTRRPCPIDPYRSLSLDVAC